MKNKVLVTIIFWSLASIHAFAANISTNMQSTANLLSMCTISVTDLNFPELNFVGNSNTFNASGDLTIFCNKGTSYTVAPAGPINSGSENLLYGTGLNKDAIHYTLNKTIDSVTNTWSRDDVYLIKGVGNGSNQDFKIGANTHRDNQPKFRDNMVTNQFNYLAKADTYSGTVTVSVNY